MQKLSGSVGENGKNAVHDVALVQAILVLARRPASLDPKSSAYLEKYDGDCGKLTKRAILNFQSDSIFVSPDGRSSQFVPTATSGLIVPDDITWKRLSVAPPENLRDLRVLENAKVIYAAASAEELSRCIASVTSATFEANFKIKVLRLINRMFEQRGIAVGVCADGARRTFQKQYELRTSGRNVTNAGPGESNHNYGQAVDLGFKDLHWLKNDGTAVSREDSWLHQLDAYKAFSGQSNNFWNALRSEGTSGFVGLFRGPLDDKPHLQAWNDNGVSMSKSLADLLTRSGKLRWTSQGSQYKCDLGYSGSYFDVGTAVTIWAGNSTVTVSAIAQASKRKPHEVKPDEVSKMNQKLLQDFQAADTNWQAWKPH
jgi:hypothetical protein